MSKKDQVNIEEDGFADEVLTAFERNREKKRRIRQRRAKNNNIQTFVIVVCLMAMTLVGGGYFVFFGMPLSALMSNPEPQQSAEQAPQAEIQPQPEEVIIPEPVQPETVILEPTLDASLLLGNPEAVMVSVETTTKSFKEQITTHIQPGNIGLIHKETGDPVFDSAVTLKYAYGNSENQAQMDLMMANASDYLHASAASGDQKAAALLEATFGEFRDAANNAIVEIPGLSENELLAKANDLGYFTSGMWYTATTPQQQAEREEIVDRASKTFAERVHVLEEEKKAQAVEPTMVPNIEPTPAEQALLNPEPESNPAQYPDPGPENEISPEKLRETFPEGDPQPLTDELLKLDLPAPKLTNYSEFPAPIATPLVGFSGMALSPEGVVLAIQQLMDLFKLGNVKTNSGWVVWNTYHAGSPFGGDVWLFLLISEETVKNSWSEMPPECQNYIGDLRVEPRRPNAWDLRDRWGHANCADYLGGDVFNQGKNLVETTTLAGQNHYILHKGPDGKVDKVGGIWFGWGEDFPLEVGQTILFQNKVVEGLKFLKTVFDAVP